MGDDENLAAIVAIAALLPSRYTRGADVLVAVAIYAVAKLAEMLDAQVYALGHLVSGHTQRLYRIPHGTGRALWSTATNGTSVYFTVYTKSESLIWHA